MMVEQVFIRKCHFDESECYEAADERVRCEMVKEGWVGIIIHCEKYLSLASDSKRMNKDE